jgi:hypothetical protein
VLLIPILVINLLQLLLTSINMSIPLRLLFLLGLKEEPSVSDYKVVTIILLNTCFPSLNRFQLTLLDFVHFGVLSSLFL